MLVGLALIICSILLPGCVSIAKADSNTVDLAGAWDTYYLSVAINSHNGTDSVVPPVKMNPSTSAIADLKKGEYDAVILGREPTAEELKGLKDYVIGYDAVVITIDENSYVGGISGLSSKSSGLQDLTTDDLKAFFGSGQLPWSGDYYTRYPLIDRNSWLFTNTQYGWDKQTKIISMFYKLIPGKYDTQTVLYRALGLEEPKTTSTSSTYTDPKMNFEEEVLTAEYPPGAPYGAGTGDFVFKVEFASRRVAAVALKHIPIRVISVDGINPLDNPGAIYDGTYPFSRKLHLLVPDNPTSAASRLVDFLQSPSGQQLISDAGYLPISPHKGIN